ncbi:MAG: energy coupling factor transporter S component ThiW [Desulfobacteraceae bacterium]|nr:MAG: energy coupling factor transporter S component ThiW [Desulfobacteraceae bacterium]
MKSNHTEPAGNYTRKAAYAVVLAAAGIALSPYTSLPIGIAKINPTQHFINMLGAVLLGPFWAMVTAAVIGLIRNVLGVGTILAFPGGMIGAILAGYLFRYTRNLHIGAFGEVIGSGIIAPVVCSVFFAPVLMGKAIPLLALIPSFLASSVTGAILGVIALKALFRADILYPESHEI